MLVSVAVMMVVGVDGRVIMLSSMMIAVATLVFAILRVIVMMIMIVVVAPRRTDVGLHVSAALGIERRLERDDPCPKSLGHRLDDRIAADAQGPRQDFSRQMAVAEMPGDAGQSERVGSPNLRQRFGGGDDFDNASVLEAQTVAAAQHRGFGEIEQEGKTADAGHGHAPAITVVEIEHHRVRRRAGPLAGGYDFVSAQHQRLSGLERAASFRDAVRLDRL
jgi:hypothetical protein